MTPTSPFQVITGKLHLYNVNAFEAKPIQRGWHKHSTSPITPNSAPVALTTVECSFLPAIGAGTAQFLAESPNEAERKFSLCDGDVECDHNACARSVFVNTSLAIPLQIMRANLESSLDSNEVNSRRYAQVSISIYAFRTGGKRGSSSGLGDVQKLRDDESTGGNHASTEADFNGLSTPSGGFSTVKKGEQK